MPDKKLTDNEIIKALECCNQNDCKTCPYGKYNTAGWCCLPKLLKDTLALINRLQAENERLKEKSIEDNELLNVRVQEAVNTVEKANQRYVDGLEKHNDELKAINESLKADKDYYIKQLVSTEEMVNEKTVQITNYLNEIERLKEENQKQKAIIEAINDTVNPLPFVTDFDIAIKTAKAEAYKEFAERLKTEYAQGINWFGKKEYYFVNVEDIDNLLKELVGDT